MPSPRCSSTSTVIGDSWFVFGGQSTVEEHPSLFNDLYRFDVSLTPLLVVVYCLFVWLVAFVFLNMCLKSNLHFLSLSFISLQFIHRSWEYVSTRNTPIPRHSAFTWSLHNHLVLFGGVSEVSNRPTALSDGVFVLNEDNTWQNYSIEGSVFFFFLFLFVLFGEIRFISLDFVLVAFFFFACDHRPTSPKISSAYCALGHNSVLVCGGVRPGSSISSNDMYRLDLERDSLRIMRVGAFDRIANFLLVDPPKAVSAPLLPPSPRL